MYLISYTFYTFWLSVPGLISINYKSTTDMMDIFMAKVYKSQSCGALMQCMVVVFAVQMKIKLQMDQKPLIFVLPWKRRLDDFCYDLLLEHEQPA